ncbi:MAG: leucine-rich repeat protein, partial [Ruminococcus sp.]|nr:leucine-rich repeat protein [Candidatus Copronaster equi]
PAIVESGKCAENVSYTLHSNGLLTISGIGEMENYQHSGDSPFYYNSSIKSIVINKGVTSMGDGAFYDCTGLTSITISDSVTSIDFRAFYECSNLKNVYYMGTEEQWKQINIGDGNECLTNATIHYIQPAQAESNVTVDGKSYSVVLDYSTALDGNVKLNISKADSGDFNIPLNPFLFVNINATSNGKTVQPQKPVTLMFEKAMFNCEIADLSIYHFPDGKTKEIFNNGNLDSDYHITVKTLNGKTYYCITVSSLSPFVFADSTGDVNSDGKINSSDALLVLQHTVKNITLTETQQKLADVNKDTFVNSNDALWILEYAVGKRQGF